MGAVWNPERIAFCLFFRDDLHCTDQLCKLVTVEIEMLQHVPMFVPYTMCMCLLLGMMRASR
jgi:hypothetical protein